MLYKVIRISRVVTTDVPAPAGAIQVPRQSPQDDPSRHLVQSGLANPTDAFIGGFYGGFLTVNGLDSLWVTLEGDDVILHVRAIARVHMQLDIHVLVPA